MCIRDRSCDSLNLPQDIYIEREKRAGRHPPQIRKSWNTRRPKPHCATDRSRKNRAECRLHSERIAGKAALPCNSLKLPQIMVNVIATSTNGKALCRRNENGKWTYVNTNKPSSYTDTKCKDKYKTEAAWKPTWRTVPNTHGKMRVENRESCNTERIWINIGREREREQDATHPRLGSY